MPIFSRMPRVIFSIAPLSVEVQFEYLRGLIHKRGVLSSNLKILKWEPAEFQAKLAVIFSHLKRSAITLP